jgi:hypothetical protein
VTAAPAQTAAPPPGRRAAARPVIRPRGHGGDGPHPPQSSTAASATASPSGAFSAAGLSLLATLLIGLAVPRLWARLALSARHRLTLAFSAPLEHPG